MKRASCHIPRMLALAFFAMLAGGILVRILWHVDPFIASRLFASALLNSSSMSAEVLSNPYNALAAALKDKELALAERERMLATRETRFFGEESSPSSVTLFHSGPFLFGVSGMLLTLIVINFYFDIRREKMEKELLKRTGLSSVE